MKHKKIQICRYAFYDHEAMEKHFESMAEKGWLIDKITAYTWQFRQTEPQKLHISITYFPDASELDPKPLDGQEMLEDFAAKDGWELLLRWGQMQVFCNSETNPTPVETDPVTKVDTIWRSMKKKLFPNDLVMIALSLFNILINCSRLSWNAVYFLASPTLLMTVFIWTLLLLIYIYDLSHCFRWYRKAKVTAENGLFLPLKTSRLPLLIYMVCLFIILFVMASSKLLFTVFVLFLLITVVITIIVNALSKEMKRTGASPNENRFFTAFVAVILSLGLSIFTIFKIMDNGLPGEKEPLGTYEINGFTFEIFDDELPLYVEDMIDIGDSKWTKERREHNESFLLSETKYNQHHISGGSDNIFNLTYTIVDVKVPVLYDFVKDYLVNKYQDEKQNDVVFIHHYEPIDPDVWQASAAYQVHFSDSILNHYLICWDNRIVEITFSKEITPEQIAVVVEKLKN